MRATFSTTHHRVAADLDQQPGASTLNVTKLVE